MLSACATYDSAPRSVLIVAPHPDDETLGTGGQIALLAKEGYSIHILVLTDGSRLFVSRFGTETQPPPGEISNRRKRETERSVARLGADPKNIRYLDFPDGGLSRHIEDAASIVAATIRNLDPARVYVTSAFEFHPDHRAANAVVKQAYSRLTDNKPDLWEYCVRPKPEFGPGDGPERLVEIDITPVPGSISQMCPVFGRPPARTLLSSAILGPYRWDRRCRFLAWIPIADRLQTASRSAVG